MIQHGIWQEEEDEDEQEEYGQLRQEMYQNLGERKDFCRRANRGDALSY